MEVGVGGQLEIRIDLELLMFEESVAYTSDGFCGAMRRMNDR